jgi:copper(I)-binding protein
LRVAHARPGAMFRARASSAVALASALMTESAVVAALALASVAQVAPGEAVTPPPVTQPGSAPTATTPPSAVRAAPLLVFDAWVRATPGSDMAAAYLTLRNTSSTAVTVTGIQSPLAGHAMIHETTVEDGLSRMRPHEQLVVAQGATLKLQPGGLHVMLHDLKQPLAVGSKVPLVILLAGGGTVRVTALVRPLGAE